MTNLLELQNLKKYFATQKAVDDMSFSIQKGSIFGLLGPNGAGKTTLLRMITGIFYPDSGQILFDGKKFDPLNDAQNIGYLNLEGRKQVAWRDFQRVQDIDVELLQAYVYEAVVVEVET